VLLHAESLAEHGGLWGLRDEAALQSALARPRNVQAYEPGADAARFAAAYGFGIVRSIPSATETNEPDFSPSVSFSN